MKSSALLLVLVLVCLAASSGAVVGAGPVLLDGQEQGTVTGYVTDGNTTLRDVKVILSNSNANFSAFTMAPLGRFTMENVTSGTYIAYAVKDGYVSGIYPDPVVVTDGTLVELNFTLNELVNQPARLSGTITSNGEPLSGAKVVLSPLDGNDQITTTDSKGSYTFKSVVPGQYELLVTKNGYIGTSQKVLLESFKEKLVDIGMKKDNLPGNSGFLMGYDLPHSLMIVALGLALSTTLAALFVRYRAKGRPEILEKERDE